MPSIINDQINQNNNDPMNSGLASSPIASTASSFVNAPTATPVTNSMGNNIPQPIRAINDTPPPIRAINTPPVGTPNTAISPVMGSANESDINNSYAKNFGRPVDAAGLNYWKGQIASNPSWTAEHLNSAISGGAQVQDKAALTSLGGNGNIAADWTQSGLNANDVSGSKDTWNTETKQWVAPTLGTSSTNTGTPQGTLMAPPVPFKSTPTIAPSIQAPIAQTYQPTVLGTPATWNVAANQTVAAQMAKLADPNNPYYQMWANAGAQDDAARGFTGNSSIRSTGILDSVMRNAMPVANADASTYAKAAGYNADQMNQFSVQNMNSNNTAGQFNANAANVIAGQKLASDTSLASAKMGADASIHNSDTAANASLQTSTIGANASIQNANTSAETQRAIASLSESNKLALQTMQNDNAQFISSNSSATNMYQSYMNTIATIQNSALTPDAKNQAVANAITNMHQGLQTLNHASGADLSQYFIQQSVTDAKNAYGDPVGTTYKPDGSINVLGKPDAHGNPAGSTYNADGSLYVQPSENHGNYRNNRDN